jgi:hypothetical protein
VILREYPFTRPSREHLPKQSERSDIDVRRDILVFLREERPLDRMQSAFLAEHPEHAEWIKDKIEPQFWTGAELSLEERQDERRAGRLQALP